MSKIPWKEILSVSPQDLVKVLLTALAILLVTKVQVYSDKLSAFLIALPLSSIVAMVWMRAERPGETERIASHAHATFWFVLPTLPMFLILPWMLRSGWNFWPALGVNCAITAGCFWLTVAILRHFGTNLMP